MDVRVLEIVRGEQAWLLIDAAFPFNDPPPTGWEYLLLRLWVKNTSTAMDEAWVNSADFHLTGSGLISYPASPVVVPDPELNAHLPFAGDSEGWVAFLTRQGDNRLLLVIEPLRSAEDDRSRFIALEQDASHQIDPTLTAITPTARGIEQSAPVSIGETAITEDWQITVLDAFAGETALQMVLGAHNFNDPPEAGTGYLVPKVRVRYIGLEDAPKHMDSGSFESSGNGGQLYDPPFVDAPHPPLDVTLYPGGQYDGWLVVQVAQNEIGPVFVFEPFLEWSGQNRRYLSLQ